MMMMMTDVVSGDDSELTLAKAQRASHFVLARLKARFLHDRHGQPKPDDSHALIRLIAYDNNNDVRPPPPPGN